MNLDEIKRELTYQAALTYYDEFDIKKVQELFLALMNHGVYSDDSINLKSDLSIKDSIFIFHSELNLLSIYSPENKQIALYFILKYHIENIANKNIDPIKELYKMMHYHNAFYLSIPCDSRYEELSKNPYDIDDLHDLYMWHDSELSLLSFPDSQVLEIKINTENKLLSLSVDNAYLDQNAGVNTDSGILTINDWEQFETKIYSSEGEWCNDFDELKDIGEFLVSDGQIKLRGFGKRTGQWVEYIFSNAKANFIYNREDDIRI